MYDTDGPVHHATTVHASSSYSTCTYPPPPQPTYHPTPQPTYHPNPQEFESRLEEMQEEQEEAPKPQAGNGSGGMSSSGANGEESEEGSGEGAAPAPPNMEVCGVRVGVDIVCVSACV